jgi:diketogulonate reductase-like aldo/keto reductase
VSSNGRKTFYNQVIAAYTGWVDSRNSYGQAVRFGDGSEIPQEFIKGLEAFMKDNAFVYRWERGMLVIVDNSVAYHSRQPFKGPRRIFAAIANGIKEIDLRQPAVSLTTGDSMPIMGLGLWKIPNDKCEQVVSEAITKAGYRLLDSACDYGNEVEVGLGIKKALAEGSVKREDLWVTSKLWNTYHRKEHVKAACLKSLQDLGLDYLDLYLIHFPIPLKFVPFEERYPPGWNYLADKAGMVGDPVSLAETWAAMEDLVREGLVRNIGVSNMGTSQIRDLLTYAKIKPTVLQIEAHPYLVQEKLVRFARSQGIAVTAFSNLGAGSYV